MAKLTNTIIYGTSNVTGTSINTGNTFDISANGGIYLSGGNSVTSIILTNGGSGYSTTPNITISNPTTTGIGGYPATANAYVGLWGGSLTNAGSGYAVNDIISYSGGISYAAGITKIQVLTVNGTGAILTSTVYQSNYGSYWTPPANPVSTTANTGVGVGATFTNVWTVYSVVITNGGAGYTEPPVVSFTAPGSPTGLAQAYAVVGANTKVQSLSANLDFYAANTNILRLITNTGNQYPTNGNLPAFAFLPPQSQFGTGSFLAATQCYYITNSNHVFQTNAPAGMTMNGASGQTQFFINNGGAAVNYLQVSGNTTGNGPIVSAQGSDTNVDLNLIAKGSGSTYIRSNGNTAFKIDGVYGAGVNGVNYWNPSGSSTGNGLRMDVGGTDTDVSMFFIAKGGGSIFLNNGGSSGTTQFKAAGTASAVNYVQASGAITNNGPILQAAGSDSSINLNVLSKLNGIVYIGSYNNAQQVLAIVPTASGSNYNNLQITNGAGGIGGPIISPWGIDTNIALTLSAKGTGPIIANTTSGLYSNTAIYTNSLYYANGSPWVMGGGGGGSSVSTYSTTIGDGTNTTYRVLHNLAKTNIITTIRESTSGNVVYPSLVYANNNQMNVTFVSAPSSGFYTVSIVGF